MCRVKGSQVDFSGPFLPHSRELPPLTTADGPAPPPSHLRQVRGVPLAEKGTLSLAPEDEPGGQRCGSAATSGCWGSARGRRPHRAPAGRRGVRHTTHVPRRRGRGQVWVQVDSGPRPRPTPQQAVEPGGSLQASDSPWGQDRPVCCENPRRCDPEWSPGAGGPTRQQAPPPCSSKSWEKWSLPPQLGDEQIEALTG